MAGQIIPRGPGKWLVRAFRGSKQVDGKRKKQYASKVVEGTYAAADRALAALVTEVDTGTFVPPATQTLKEYVEWWLTEVVGARNEGATARSYRDRISGFLVEVGHFKLDKATPPVLQKALNKLAQERRWSKRTTRYTKTVLSMALNEAVRQGLLRANPAAALVLPRVVDLEESEQGAGGEPVSAVWTQEQVRLFLESTQQSSWHPVWHLLLNGGMRPGEVLGLQWSDLSSTNLTIQRAVKQDGKGGWIVGPPKTRGSRRTIALPLHTISVLRSRRAESGQLHGYIVGEGDAPLTVTQLRAAWERDVRKSGLPDIGLYGCRHTHATLLLTLGVPIKVVSERLGHAKVQITMDTYQHVLPHMQEEVAAKLNTALGG